MKKINLTAIIMLSALLNFDCAVFVPKDILYTNRKKTVSCEKSTDYCNQKNFLVEVNNSCIILFHSSKETDKFISNYSTYSNVKIMTYDYKNDSLKITGYYTKNYYNSLDKYEPSNQIKEKIEKELPALIKELDVRKEVNH